LLTAAVSMCAGQATYEVRIVATLDDALALRSGHLRLFAIQGPRRAAGGNPHCRVGSIVYQTHAHDTPPLCPDRLGLTRAFSCADMGGVISLQHLQSCSP
jgi:hypothetical protein